MVCRIAGEGFFRHAARDYVRAHPPRAPQLWAYGGKFEKFLERYEPARPLRFLPDLARLEWAWNESYFQSEFQRVCCLTNYRVNPILCCLLVSLRHTA